MAKNQLGKGMCFFNGLTVTVLYGGKPWQTLKASAWDRGTLSIGLLALAFSPIFLKKLGPLV